MKKFEGKVLLELGTSIASVDIVKYAKSEGAYVIVTDYLPIEKSEAKQYADETAMISTLDVEGVYELAKAKHIDGIFCGVSEANLETVYKVAERLGLPCYLNEKYFRLNRDKLFFKNTCKKYGITVPELYCLNEENIDEVSEKIQFPVVVKPNDEGAGVGVKICSTKAEMEIAYLRAKELSGTNSAFVEEYVEGDELTAFYTMKNGVVSLSCLQDKLLSKDHKNITSLNDVLLSPSRHLNSFLEKQNEKVIDFLKSELYDNGTAFLQGIYRGGQVYFIEMGCRMSGGAEYFTIEHENGISFMKLLVDYALLGDCSDFDISADDPCFKKISGKLKLIAHKGIIAKMEGAEVVRTFDGAIYAGYKRRVGDEIIEDGTLRQYVFECFFSCDSYDQVAVLINKVQNTVAIEDIDGHNMLFKPFDVNRLLD